MLGTSSGPGSPCRGSLTLILVSRLPSMLSFHYSHSPAQKDLRPHTCSRCCAEGREKCQVSLASSGILCIWHLVNYVYEATLKTTQPTLSTQFAYFRFFYLLLWGSQESLFYCLQNSLTGLSCVTLQISSSLQHSKRAVSISSSAMLSGGKKIQKYKRRNKSVWRNWQVPEARETFWKI